MRWRASALLTLVAMGAAGCTDRAIGLAACDDGVLEAGEVCWSEPALAGRTPFQPLVLHVADFDGDGHLDALVVGHDAAIGITSALLPGDGTGALGPAADAHVYGCTAYPLPGDLDGDAATDLLGSECGPSMLIFAGGQSGFGDPRSISTGVVAHAASILDIDDDGSNDVVLIGADDAGRDTLNVVRADGRGGFAPAVASVMPAVAPDFRAGHFRIADFDEDGLHDALLVDTEAPGGFALALGGGDGTFAAPNPVMTGVSPTSVWVDDFDTDGRIDLLLRVDAEADLVLARGDGRGAFTEHARTTADPAAAPVLLDDFDGDGLPDILFARPLSRTLEVRLGSGDGTFGPPEPLEAEAAPDHVVLADLDEDGADDLVMGMFADREIRVMLANP